MNHTQNPENSKDEININIPNPFEIWKKMYFAAEDALSSTAREAISTNAFSDTMDNILSQYLTWHKVAMQTGHKFLNYSPFPSKEDVARVAELVIAMEDKIDKMDATLMMQLSRITQAVSSQLRPAEQVRQSNEESQDFQGPEHLLMRLDRLEEAVGQITKLLSDFTQNFSQQPKRKSKKVVQEKILTDNE